MVKVFTGIVDPIKIGYNLTVVILIQADGAHLEEVEQEIAKSGYVLCVYDITGDFDIAVIARFQDRALLNSFIKGILKVPHVTRTATNVILNVIKEDFRINA